MEFLGYAMVADGRRERTIVEMRVVESIVSWSLLPKNENWFVGEETASW